jgi:C-terminal processing protease CtpA/Prc
VIVLIDERTQGAAERLALALESATTVTFVGSQSAGAASLPVPLELPGALTVGIPVVEVRRGDGGQLQRVGITPAVDARPTTRGIRNRDDEVLQRAQQWIAQQLDTPVRRKR